jgi:hypothetical protein
MTIKAGEKGQPFRIAADFDMSGSTGLSIKFTKPDGTTTFTVTEASGSPVTAPAVALTNDPGFNPVRSVAASEYFEYTSTGLEFDVDGEWTACGLYEDASLTLEANTVTFTIGETCF